MVTNAAAEPSVQAPDPEQDEEMGFTVQQLRFLRQLVQGQPWEERPRTLDPTPGETHRMHVALPNGLAGLGGHHSSKGDAAVHGMSPAKPETILIPQMISGIYHVLNIDRTCAAAA